MRDIIALLRLVLFVLVTFVLVPVHLLVVVTTRSMAVTHAWHRAMARIFAIRVRWVGNTDPANGKPRAYVCNHVSYLDIIAMGGRMEASFVAKSEVASWPLFGYLAKLQNTIFIERRRGALEASHLALAQALKSGRDIVLFAEGTSTDGRTVLPFKPALFDVFYEQGVTASVVPVALVLERVDGRVPVTQADRDVYAWWRPETTLVPHLWAFARTRGVQVAVHVLDGLDPATFADRKILAKAAHDKVCAVVEAALKPPVPDVPVAQLDRAMVS